METKAFREWIGRIYATSTDELDCDETQARLPAYVDAELQGSTPDTAVADHLHQCSDCMEIFDGLRYVAELEQQGMTASEATGPGELTAVARS